MKFINFIEAWMKKIKLKCDEASISKLTMFFAICDECYIKGRSTTKIADLMIKYVFANTYHISISRTSIDINFKSIKTYSDSMPQNKYWWNDFKIYFYLNEAVDKS